MNIKIQFSNVLFGDSDSLCLYCAVLQKWNIDQLKRLALRPRKSKVGQVPLKTVKPEAICVELSYGS